MFNWKNIKVSRDVDALRRDSLKENEATEIKKVEFWKPWKTRKNWNKYSEEAYFHKPEDFSNFLEKLDFIEDYKPIDKFEDDIAAYEDWLDNDYYGNDITTPEAKHSINGAIADLGDQEHLINDSDLDKPVKDDLHRRLNDVVDRLLDLLKENTIVVSEADDMAQSAKPNGARKVEVPESEPTGVNKKDYKLDKQDVQKTSIDSKKDPFKEAGKGPQEYCIKLTIHTVHGFQDLYTCFDLYQDLHYSSFKERVENLPSLDDRKTAEEVKHLVSKDYFNKYQDYPIIRVVKASRETLEESKMRESLDEESIIEAIGVNTFLNEIFMYLSTDEQNDYLETICRNWDIEPTVTDITELLVNYGASPESIIQELSKEIPTDDWNDIISWTIKNYDLDDEEFEESKLTEADKFTDIVEKVIKDVETRWDELPGGTFSEKTEYILETGDYDDVSEEMCDSIIEYLRETRDEDDEDEAFDVYEKVAQGAQEALDSYCGTRHYDISSEDFNEIASRITDRVCDKYGDDLDDLSNRVDSDPDLFDEYIRDYLDEFGYMNESKLKESETDFDLEGGKYSWYYIPPEVDEHFYNKQEAITTAKKIGAHEVVGNGMRHNKVVWSDKTPELKTKPGRTGYSTLMKKFQKDLQNLDGSKKEGYYVSYWGWGRNSKGAFKVSKLEDKCFATQEEAEEFAKANHKYNPVTIYYTDGKSPLKEVENTALYTTIKESKLKESECKYIPRKYSQYWYGVLDTEKDLMVWKDAKHLLLFHSKDEAQKTCDELCKNDKVEVCSDGCLQLKEGRYEYGLYVDDEENETTYDPDHAAEWMNKHPYGYYNNEDDYGVDADDEEDEEDFPEIDWGPIDDFFKKEGYILDEDWPDPEKHSYEKRIGTNVKCQIKIDCNGSYNELYTKGITDRVFIAEHQGNIPTPDFNLKDIESLHKEAQKKFSQTMKIETATEELIENHLRKMKLSPKEVIVSQRNGAIYIFGPDDELESYESYLKELTGENVYAIGGNVFIPAQAKVYFSKKIPNILKRVQTFGNFEESKMRESLLDDFDGDEVALRDYLFDKEKVTALDKEEMFMLQDLIQKYGKPEEKEIEDESLNINDPAYKEKLFDRIVDQLELGAYEDDFIHDVNNLRALEWYDEVIDGCDHDTARAFRDLIKDQLEAEVFDYLENTYNVDYNQRVEDLVEDFGFDKDEAEAWVNKWVPEAELKESRSFKNWPKEKQDEYLRYLIEAGKKYDKLHELKESYQDNLEGIREFVDTYCSEHAYDFSDKEKDNLAKHMLGYIYEMTDENFDINDPDNLDDIIRKYLENPEDFRESKLKESLLDDFNDDPVALRNYLLNKEEVADLDKEERYTLQNLIQEYGYPDEDESEEVDFDEVYDAAIDALDWYLYEHKNYKCTDEQKEEAAKNMAQTIIDDGEWDPDNEYIFDGMIEGTLEYIGVKLNESKMKESKKLIESQEKDITIDFPITVNEKGRIKANDAKKLLKYLAQNKMLRLGRTWYVKDSTGRETCWTLMKGYFDEYVFSCEITDSIEDENGNYDELDWYNGLSFSKSNGKLTDFEWESYKVN